MATLKPRQLERIFKGAANHRRWEILFLLKRQPGATLGEIAYELGCNMKTIAEHCRRLMLAGLVTKLSRGREVGHTLSRTGTRFIAFASSLSLS